MVSNYKEFERILQIGFSRRREWSSVSATLVLYKRKHMTTDGEELLNNKLIKPLNANDCC